MRYAYLGPAGTYTEEATRKFFPSSRAKGTPYSSNRAVVEAVAGGLAAGIVPIENSIEGTVNEAMDAIIAHPNITIVGEVVLPVTHCLLATPDAWLPNIKRVRSHPQALAQCRRWLSQNLPNAELEEAPSTARAAAAVAEAGDPSIAAIASQRAAEVYGCKVLRVHIGDEVRNKTRFVTVSSRWRPTPDPACRSYRVAVVFALPDRPGTLMRVLEVFAAERINMTKIESRPSRRALGEYLFWLEFERPRRGVPQYIVRRLKQRTEWLRILGAFPAAPRG